MTTSTLIKPTDTPRATAAPKRAPRKTPVSVKLTIPTIAPAAPTKAAAARVKTAEFVKLVKDEEKNTGKKVQIIGLALASGATNKDITDDLTAALLKADRVVPKSFASSVTHYATAYAAANTVHHASNLDCLHAAYQISTGVVPAAAREKFIEEFGSGSAEAFISEARALLKKHRDLKSGKTPATDGPDELDELPEVPALTISPVAEFKALMRQAGKMLDLAAENDDDADYMSMLDEALAFAATFTDDSEV